MSHNIKFCPVCASELIRQEDGGRVRKACPDSICGWVHYENPTPVVAAIVEHEGDIVLVQSHGWPTSLFALVAGFLEKGETMEAGILREVEEELELQGEIVERIGVYDYLRRDQILIVFHVRATGTIQLGDELAAYKRQKPKDIKPWPRGTGLAVRDWLAARNLL